MAASPNQTLKTALALMGLLGTGAFTFLRIFDDGGKTATSTESIALETPRRRSEPTSAEPSTVASVPVPSAEKNPEPKALTWDDYLHYDPFSGRGNPTEEILALAAGPSPFFAETIVVSQGPGRSGPNPAEKHALSAILGSSGNRIAVIDNRPYRSGEYLLNKDGEREDDAEYGALRISRIEADRIEIVTGGLTFSLKLAAEEQALVRGAQEKSSSKKSKE